MFKCPSCGADAKRLIAAVGFPTLRCPGCYEERHEDTGASRHLVKFHKWGTRMTVAEANRIKTNKKRADGQYHPDKRWSTSGDW